MRITALVLIATLLVVVALASACETTVTSGGTTRYNNDEYGFSFEIADRFEQADDVSDLQAAAPNADFQVGFFNLDGATVNDTALEGLAVRVFKLNTEVTPDLMPQFKKEIQTGIDQLAAADPSMTAGPLSDTTVNGLPGLTYEFASTTGNVRLKTREYFLVDGATEYEIVMQSAEDSWVENEPDLQKAADSFKVK